jgi:hypothetical protein
MLEAELNVPDGTSTDAVVRIIEHVCTANHLICTLKGSLVGYPGSVHWHFKKGIQKGILEVTWWGAEHRLWFKVAKNRIGDWIEDSIPRLKEQIEKSLY